jgi:NADH-quinone oxidoreductase subunit G
MATIYIDNRPYQANSHQNLLQVCLSLGFDLPYFCWHPALGSVGACRQCAVKQFRDEADTRGRLVMACMLPAADDTRIAIDDADARAFRASVIEWLMTNHPHDCPVCDEGGHCHLQDMTIMTGHTYRRYRFPKRTFRNQDLGPFINHEMNRCIQCYRCVRFYRDYAGGRDLDAFASRNHVYFGRHEDGVLENEFSGNLVEVCPTGVFTDKTLKQHYTRKWDLQTAPSLCVHCGLGCNIIPGERYGTLREVVNRYNREVNGYFLCDRGRFGYGFVNSEQRLRQPWWRREASGKLEAVPKERALEHIAALCERKGQVLGIGSPRASLEANFALRTLVGPEHFYWGVSARDGRLLAAVRDILQHGPARTPSLRDVELADAVLVLGEDVTNVAPRLALALRQSVRQQPMRIADTLKIPRWNDAAVREAVQQQKGPLFIATPLRTQLDDVATRTYRAAPHDIARLGFAVAHALTAEASPVEELSDTVRILAEDIARVLAEAERPLVVAGTSLGSEAVIHAAANVAWALCQAGRQAALCFAVPECNSLGLSLMGGNSLAAAMQAVQGGAADTVMILENDLYRRADAASVRAFLNACAHIMVIDHFTHETMQHAEVVLPAATFAEADGTLVSNEGRAQRFFQVFMPEGDTQESWRWVRDLMALVGQREGSAWQGLDDVIEALVATLPGLAGVRDSAPAADFRIVGQKIPRQPHRYSGRTAMAAHLTVHEPTPPVDPDAPLAFSMEGYTGQPPSPLIPFFWAPRWSSPQALNKFQSEVGGPLRGGDPGVRLIEPAVDGQIAFFGDVPAAFAPRTNAWLCVPLYHIFTEELSMMSPPVAARMSPPALVLNPHDAAALDVAPDEEVTCYLSGAAHRLPVRIDPTLPVGIAGLPARVLAFAGTEMPLWGVISQVEES